ncbi:hypothetical protein ACW6QP_06630 [Salegentibacter sp. HM20]
MNYRVYLPLLILLCFSLHLPAQEMRLLKGKTTDFIPVQDSLSSSFALYLPTDFDLAETWPVLIVFDPQGRGHGAAQQLRSIAEDQGYLVVASNDNLLESALQEQLTSTTRLFRRVLGTLPVDTNQIYTAGLAEGGILASAVPLIYDNLAGVLAIGDAWINPDVLKKNRRFMFNGLAGRQGLSYLNFPEIRQYFDKAKHPTEINFYEGNDREWPANLDLYAAVSGFTLQAMREGFRETDTALVSKMFQQEIELSERLRRRGRLFDAVQKLEQLQDKYEGFPVQIDLRQRIRDLTDSNFRSQRREYNRNENLELEKREEYQYYLETDLITSNFENIGWWVNEMEELEKMQENANPFRSNVGHRLEAYLKLATRDYYNQIMETDANIDMKVYTAVLRTVLDNNDPEAYLKIIEIAGGDGDMETAMLYLEDLLKTGFSDMEKLYKMEGMLDLKFSREYNALIKKYLGKSKYYDEATPEAEVVN